MDSQFLSPKSQTAAEASFDPSKQEYEPENAGMPTLALAQLHIFNLYRQLPTAKPLQSRYDLSQLHIRHLRLFFPSPTAKRSFFYLQTLIEASFGARYFTERRDLLSYLMIQTTEGEGILHYCGKEYHLRKGDVFLIDCTKPHRYQTAFCSWSYRLIHFFGESMPDFFRFFEKCGIYVFHLGQENAATPLIQDLFSQSRNDSPLRETDVHSLLTRLVTVLIAMLPSPAQPTLPDKIRRVEDWLHRNFTRAVCLDDIAQEFSISKYHLCREYKRCTGQTILETVTQDRIDAAKKLLAYSELSIQVIAEHTGFADNTAFGRTFKKSEGLSPSAFRRQWKS